MIIISPYSKALRTGTPNPKNYPHWKKLIPMINEPIVQIGVTGEEQLVDDFRVNLSMEELSKLVHECRTWIGVDSFFQHFCWDLNKPGIVLWGQSDSNIYGHPENTNLLKSRDYLFHNQFLMWEMIPLRTDCFVEPEAIVHYL